MLMSVLRVALQQCLSPADAMTFFYRDSVERNKSKKSKQQLDEIFITYAFILSFHRP